MVWLRVLAVVGISLAMAGVAAPASAAASAGEEDPCSVQVQYPTGGATVSGVVAVPVTVNEAESFAPDKTEVFVDGVLAGTDDNPTPVTEGGCSGFLYYSEPLWDTTEWGNGSYQVQGRATRADGSQFWSDNTITLTVAN